MVLSLSSLLACLMASTRTEVIVPATRAKQMGAYTVINMVVDTANLKFVKPSNADNVDIYHTISAASRHILDK